MCLMKAPEIKVPDTPTPAPLPPPVDTAATVDSVKFGSESDTETSSGIKGKSSKGKKSLQVDKKKPATIQKAKTGANYA